MATTDEELERPREALKQPAAEGNAAGAANTQVCTWLTLPGRTAVCSSTAPGPPVRPQRRHEPDHQRERPPKVRRREPSRTPPGQR